MKVHILGYMNAIFCPGGSNWQSDNLEKIYINSDNIFFYNGLFFDCPNIKKYILIKKQYYESKFLDLRITTYMTSSYYLNDLGGDENLVYFLDGELRWRGANVSYYYNYDGSPNDGYYWIDDVEDGEVIEFIPQEPTREGYVFEGWYKEEECENKWNFEEDTVIKAMATEPYFENKLFAKWEKE